MRLVPITSRGSSRSLEKKESFCFESRQLGVVQQEMQVRLLSKSREFSQKGIMEEIQGIEIGNKPRKRKYLTMHSLNDQNTELKLPE